MNKKTHYNIQYIHILVVVAVVLIILTSMKLKNTFFRICLLIITIICKVRN